MRVVICPLCLRPVPRRWWQRGLFQPLPFCPPSRRAGCDLFRLVRRMSPPRPAVT